MAKELDCVIQVSEFELQSRYYIYFRVNTFREVKNPIITLAMS